MTSRYKFNTIQNLIEFFFTLWYISQAMPPSPIEKLSSIPIEQLPSKIARLGVSFLIRSTEEWHARAGGLQIKPSILSSLISGGSITPGDSAIQILNHMNSKVRIDDAALKIFGEQFPTERSALISDAANTSSGRFRILGKNIDFSRGIHWNYDSANGYYFEPTTFYANIKHSDPKGGYDIKYPWELSRLQHFPRLALAYKLTGDEMFLDAMFNQMRKWNLVNPPGFGPNWACTMDIAIRAANLAIAWGIIGGNSNLTEEFHQEIACTLIEHGRFVRTHLEWSGELTSNHYLSDIAGLAILGSVLSPLVNEATGWIKFSKSELEKEILKQVNPDGTDFEASTSYHRLAMECFLVAAIYIERSGLSFSDEYKNRLGLMAEFLRGITMQDGTYPLIGDNDSGTLIGLHPHEKTNLNYLLALCAAYFGDSSLKPDSLKASPEILWLLGEEKLAEFKSLENTPRPDMVSNPDFGLWLARSGDNVVSFRNGPVGQKGNGGHAHNDYLSFTLAYNGKPFFIDPGSGVYTSNPQRRNNYRSAFSHSTIIIDKKEPNAFVDGNLFTLPSNIRTVAEMSEAGGIVTFHGKIFGYGGWNEDEVSIERILRFNTSTGKIEIEDSIKLAPHLTDIPIEWRFPVMPGMEVLFENHAAKLVDMTSGSKVVELVYPDNWAAKSMKTVYSPEYGVEKPNITIRLRPSARAYSAQFIIRPLTSQ